MEGFALTETNEVDLVLEDTFIEPHTVDVRCKLIQLVVCHDSKDVTLKFKISLMMRKNKLNLVTIVQMNNKYMVGEV